MPKFNYIDETGKTQTIDAPSSDVALATAPNINKNSGVQAIPDNTPTIGASQAPSTVATDPKVAPGTPANQPSGTTPAGTSPNAFSGFFNGGKVDSNSFTSLLNNVGNNLKYNNELVSSRQLLMKNLYDSPLTPEEIAKLPKDVQTLVQSGDKNALELQIRVMNDQIQGRAGTVAQSIQALTTGYQQSQKNIDDAVTSILNYAKSTGQPIDAVAKALGPIYGVDITNEMLSNLKVLGSTLLNTNQVAPSAGGLNLSDAIAAQESGGSYDAINSDSGALGKYQIMPAHLSEIGLDPSSEKDKQTFLNSPELQDQLHLKIINDLSVQYNGDTDKILAAYYGGDGAAQVVGTPAGDKPQGPIDPKTGKGKYPSINDYVAQVKSRINDSIADSEFSAARPDGATANKVDPATGQTPNAVYQSALNYIYTGKMPALGLGSSNQVKAARSAILNKAGAIADALGVDQPQLQALYKANSSAAKQSIERVARVESIASAMTKNFPRLTELADKVKAQGINLQESDIQKGASQALRKFGSPDAAAYIELVQTIRSDYAATQAALAGSRGGQFFAEQATDAIPLGLSSGQYNAIKDTILLSSANAKAAINEEVQSLLGTSGVAGGGINSGASPSGASSYDDYLKAIGK